MAVEAFVGLVGGGKSYNSVRRMMSYMARGGRCCSNILLKGYNPSMRCFDSSSPVLSFLRSIGWEYQPGQYTFISFDDMLTDPTWVKRCPAGIDRDHRTLLVVDEATDLFDSLDGGRLRSDSAYREIFHFLRLSRHVHVDVLFVVQDLNSINTRLRGLVSYIWRSTDMKHFRLPKFRLPFPFNLFMLQQFDRTGKYEVKREWVKKDPCVFDLYDSEAFNNSLSVKWDGVSVSLEKGKQVKGKKKMSKFSYVLIFLSLLLSCYAVFHKVTSAEPLNNSVKATVITNVVVSTISNNSSSSTNRVFVKRGSFKYYSQTSTSPAFVLFGNARITAGSPCEYGFVRSVSSDMVFGESFEDGVFYLLPEFTPPSPDSGMVSIRLSAPATSRRSILSRGGSAAR